MFTQFEERFANNPKRHEGVEWNEVASKLKADEQKMRSLELMEDTGGQPDVIGRDPNTNEILICDCSLESPEGRRNLCYDDDALETRKKNKPRGSAIGMAKTMGIELLSEYYYHLLQELGEFDTKTSSWIQTPEPIRSLGGALFCDRRFNHVFVYHNGAESYYTARGFRGLLRI